MVEPSSCAQRAANKKTRYRKFFLETLEDRTLLSGQTFVVNITTDAGIGSGNTGDIRYCVNQANLAGNAGSTITFDKALGSTVFLSGNELALSQDMTIQGPVGGGLTITAQGLSRVFNITSPSAHVTISNLTIANGDANPSDTQFFPGNQGGDIFNSGTLSLNNDVVSNGLAEGVIGGPPARGGGIFNAHNASLTLVNTTLVSNEALGSGGMGAGGGIYNDTGASLTVSSGTIFNNNLAVGSSGSQGFSVGPPAPPGAARGIPGFPGGDGSAGFDGAGGGIYNNGALTIRRIAGPPIIFSGNMAQGGTGGGGGFGGPGGAGSKATGGTGGHGGNGAVGGNAFGGGIYNAVGSLNIDGATFTSNEALSGAGGAGGHGGKSGAGKPGAVGGQGGNGADAGQAWGGAIYNTGGDLTIGSQVGSLFTSNIAANGAGGMGGLGGTGGTGNSIAAGIGGAGGKAGGGTFAYGGAISVVSGALTISSTGFGGPTAGQGNQVIGGAGGAGGAGGTGGKSGKSGLDGAKGGPGADGGNGSFVRGGAIAVFNDATNITLNQDDFEGNSATSGSGGAGGMGGLGGKGSKSFSGSGGLGGIGHESGEAWGGGISITAPDVDDGLKHSLTITATPFLNETATAAAGGDGGAAGPGGPGGNSTAPGFPGTTGPGGLGQDARGGGLFVYNGAVSLPVSIMSSPFTNDKAIGSLGGSGFPGNKGSDVYGGAIDLWATTMAVGSATLTSSPLTNNTATAGGGGSSGGQGGLVRGGAGQRQLQRDPELQPGDRQPGQLRLGRAQRRGQLGRRRRHRRHRRIERGSHLQAELQRRVQQHPDPGRWGERRRRRRRTRRRHLEWGAGRRPQSHRRQRPAQRQQRR